MSHIFTKLGVASRQLPPPTPTTTISSSLAAEATAAGEDAGSGEASPAAAGWAATTARRVVGHLHAHPVVVAQALASIKTGPPS